MTDSATFGISQADESQIMTILRDTLYTDRVLAVMREYGGNGWDAHRSVGKSELPIKVTLPTAMEPTLRIRDYGPGLSKDGVLHVYTQYGRSTKRDSDDEVGCLGIGSKSGFSYSDSFTVTSWHGGIKSTYVAVLDESEKGIINCLAEEPCSPKGETGLEIQIPVRLEDIWDFQRKARALFQYFEPRPVINIDLPPPNSDILVLTHGAIILDSYNGWVAKMGCIPYKVNLAQVRPKTGGPMWDTLANLSGVLCFGIGEVQTNASREELKYSAVTKEKLAKKFEALVEEYVRNALKVLDEPTLPTWEKRLKVQGLNRFRFPVPESYKKMVSGTVSVDTRTVKTFALLGATEKHATSIINVTTHTRFLIRDTSHTARGYGLSANDYLICPLRSSTATAPADSPTPTTEEVRAELTPWIIANGIEGIPVALLSSLTWSNVPDPQQGYAHGKRAVNPRHHVSTFRLNPNKAFSSPYSMVWDIEQREPQDDVFVILSNFRSEGNFDIYHLYRDDVFAASLFDPKTAMPPVYGYKTTSSKPVEPKDCKGVHYPEWRVSLYQKLLTPEVKILLDHHRLHRLLGVAGTHGKGTSGWFTQMLTMLGEGHPLCKMFKPFVDGVSALTAFEKTLPYGVSPYRLQSCLDTFAQLVDLDSQKAMGQTLQKILRTYPLLQVPGNGLCSFDGEYRKAWIEYVQIVDRVNGLGNPTVG